MKLGGALLELVICLCDRLRPVAEQCQQFEHEFELRLSQMLKDTFSADLAHMAKNYKFKRALVLEGNTTSKSKG